MASILRQMEIVSGKKNRSSRVRIKVDFKVKISKLMNDLFLALSVHGVPQRHLAGVGGGDNVVAVCPGRGLRYTPE